MSGNIIPEKLNDFRVYDSGNDLMGIADVTLPSLDAMTEAVKGAGILGEAESPAVGHYSSMTVKLNWRVIVKSLIALATPEAHHLDFRGAIQQYDVTAGAYKMVPVKCVVKCLPKKSELGKMEKAAKQDAGSEMEVIYIKLDIDGKNVLELDKYNYICKINGKDYASDIKAALGMD